MCKRDNNTLRVLSAAVENQKREAEIQRRKENKFVECKRFLSMYSLQDRAEKDLYLIRETKDIRMHLKRGFTG